MTSGFSLESLLPATKRRLEPTGLQSRLIGSPYSWNDKTLDVSDTFPLRMGPAHGVNS